jgi:hypothetical protein
MSLISLNQTNFLNNFSRKEIRLALLRRLQRAAPVVRRHARRLVKKFITPFISFLTGKISFSDICVKRHLREQH